MHFSKFASCATSTMGFGVFLWPPKGSPCPTACSHLWARQPHDPLARLPPGASRAHMSCECRAGFALQCSVFDIGPRVALQASAEWVSGVLQSLDFVDLGFRSFISRTFFASLSHGWRPVIQKKENQAERSLGAVCEEAGSGFWGPASPRLSPCLKPRT